MPPEKRWGYSSKREAAEGIRTFSSRRTVSARASAFDIDRWPNDHIAFGVGEHFCLGASLARLQLSSIFGEILTRLPDIEVDGPVRYLRSNFIDGIKEMRVRFTPESQRRRAAS